VLSYCIAFADLLTCLSVSAWHCVEGAD